MNETIQTILSIVVTVLILLGVVLGIYIMYRIETRRARLAEMTAPGPPPRPSPYGIQLPDWRPAGVAEEPRHLEANIVRILLCWQLRGRVLMRTTAVKRRV